MVSNTLQYIKFQPLARMFRMPKYAKYDVDAKKFFWVPKIFAGCQKTTFWHPRMPHGNAGEESERRKRQRTYGPTVLPALENEKEPRILEPKRSRMNYGKSTGWGSCHQSPCTSTLTTRDQVCKKVQSIDHTR